MELSPDTASGSQDYETRASLPMLREHEIGRGLAPRGSACPDWLLVAEGLVTLQLSPAYEAGEISFSLPRNMVFAELVSGRSWLMRPDQLQLSLSW